MELFALPCPTCGARLKVKSRAAIGQIFNCPKCQSMVLVQPPPGWVPPPLEECPSPPTAVAKPQPGDLGVPVATLMSPDAEAPFQATSQFPVQTGWHRGAWIGTSSLAVLLVIALAWWAWRSPPGEPLVFEPFASPAVETRADPAPAPAEEISPEASEPPVEEVLPLRWLPPDARLVLSLRLAQLADQEVAPEVFASGISPLPQSLAELQTSFGLQPSEVRRITWAVDDSQDLRNCAVVIELAQPLEDDAALLAGSQRLDVRLHDAVCHQPPAGGWPHPFAITDAQTVITGPLEVLAEIGLRSDAAAESDRYTAALAMPSAATLTLVIDVPQWPAADRLQWPDEIDEQLAALESWPLLRDATQAVRFEIDASEKTTAQLRLFCSTVEAATEVERALRGALPSLADDSIKAALSGAEVSRQETEVSWQSTWPGDSRLLAAALLANLPRWETHKPVEPVATVVAAAPSETPAPPATAAVPAQDRQTPFQKQVDRRFQERIPSLVLSGMKLEEFVRFFSRMTGITVVLDDEALLNAGVDPKTPLNVDLTAATIGEVLDTALAGHELGYLAEDSRLLITTRAKAEAQTTTP